MQAIFIISLMQEVLTGPIHSMLCLLLPFVSGHPGAHSVPSRAGPRDNPQGHLRLRPGPVRQRPQAAGPPAGASGSPHLPGIPAPVALHSDIVSVCEMLSLLICCLLWQEILEPTLYHPSYDPETIHKAVFGFAQGPSASGRKLQAHLPVRAATLTCRAFQLQLRCTRTLPVFMRCCPY